MPNSVDPDETAHYEPSHLDLRCLQKPIVIAFDSLRVKSKSINTCRNKNGSPYFSNEVTFYSQELAPRMEMGWGANSLLKGKTPFRREINTSRQNELP